MTSLCATAHFTFLLWDFNLENTFSPPYLLFQGLLMRKEGEREGERERETERDRERKPIAQMFQS